MDLLIQNATMEEITTICSRIASPSFDEMMDESRLEGIAKHINNGDSVDVAKHKWQEELVDEAEKAMTNPDGTKTITREEIKREMNIQDTAPKVEVKTEVTNLQNGQTFGHTGSEDLHLDGPPPKDTVTLNSVMKLATEVAKAGKTEFLRQMVKEFGVGKVKELKPEDLEPAYKKLKAALPVYQKLDEVTGRVK